MKSQNKIQTFKAFVRNLKAELDQYFLDNTNALEKASIQISRLASIVLYLRNTDVYIKPVNDDSSKLLLDLNKLGRTSGHTERDLKKNDLILTHKILEHILDYDDERLFAVAEGITIAEIMGFIGQEKYAEKHFKFKQRQSASKSRSRTSKPIYDYLLKVALKYRSKFTLKELLERVSKNEIPSTMFADFSFDPREGVLRYTDGKKDLKVSADAVRRNLRKDKRIQSLMK